MLEFDYLENFDDECIEDLEYDKIYYFKRYEFIRRDYRSINN